MKEFKVKVSYGFFSVVIGAIFVPLLFGLITTEGDRVQTIMPYFILLTLVGLYAVSSFLCLRYQIVDNYLIVKLCGFTFTKVAVADIKMIEATNVLTAGPAPSFDRLLISYGNYNNLILSPKDKIAFSACLKKMNPSIKLKLKED